MDAKKAVLLTGLITATGLLSGCFDLGQEPPAESAKNEAANARTAAQTWTRFCVDCGTYIAFSAVTNPANYYGWALHAGGTYDSILGGYTPIRRITYLGNSNMPGGLVDIDLRSNNQLWGVNFAGGVFHNDAPTGNDPQSWAQITTPAPARRIGTGTDKVWILTQETSPGGYKLYYYNETAHAWIWVSAGLVEIDSDNNGDLWGVNNNQEVFRLPAGNPNNAWELKYAGPGPINIACGGGKVYIMTTATAAGGNQLKAWNGSTFVSIPGGVKDIMVDVSGRLWAANTSNDLFYYTP